jgi:hypothetical protein
VISLLSAHRKVSSTALTVESVAAATAAAGSLRSKDNIATVVHDDFRLLPQGSVQTRVAAHAQGRRELIARKLERESERARATAELAVGKATIADLVKQLEGTADNEALRTQLEEHRGAAANCRSTQYGHTQSRLF